MKVKDSFMALSESISFENKSCPTPTSCKVALDVINPYYDYNKFLVILLKRILVLESLKNLDI